MKPDPARILVVDDDRENAEFLVESLSGPACLVYAFRDPRAALRDFRRGKYQVGILDIKMPQMSGVELFARLREADPEIGLIILTAYPSVDSALATLKKGAYDYVRKPYRIEALKQIVYPLLEQKGYFLDEDRKIHQRVGARLKEYRTQASWTIARLASQTHLSKSLISQIENGKNTPSLATLYKIARTLRVPVSDLVQDL